MIFFTTISYASMIQNIFQISEFTMRFSRSRGGGKNLLSTSFWKTKSANLHTLLSSSFHMDFSHWVSLSGY